MSSKPFASLAVLLVLSGAAQAQQSASDKASAPPAPSSAGAPAAPAPVPERAAQQFAQALALIKSGRATDAELGL